MVYKSFNNNNIEHNKTANHKQQTKDNNNNCNKHRLHPLAAVLLVKLTRLALFIYDILSLPIYFLIQRPDKRALEAQRIRSERVDVNTWIKTDPIPNETSSSVLNGPLAHGDGCTNKRLKHKFMGSTLDETFANAIKEFSSRPCLGYRAVVTCPIFLSRNGGTKTTTDKSVTEDENNQNLAEQSFRSDYTWYTYEQIGRRVQDIASGLYYYSVYPASRVMFLASTSLEWFCAAQACIQLNAQLVIAPEMEDVSSLKLVLEEAEVSIIFISCDRLSLLCKLLDSVKAEVRDVYHIKRVVIIDWLFPLDYNEQPFANLRISAKLLIEQVLSMGQIEETGVENPIELRCTKSLDYDQQPNGGEEISDTSWKDGKFNADENVNKQSGLRRSVSDAMKRPKNEHLNDRKSVLVELANKKKVPIRRLDGPRRDSSAKPADLAMIIYTSGSMGQIKAIMLSHSHLARCNRYLFLDGMVQGNDIHCGSLALDDIIEFMTEMCIISHGGSIGYSGDQNTLFYDGKALFARDRSDLSALNPTCLLVRPYHLERLRTSVQNYLTNRLNPLISFILTHVLYDYKKYWARYHYGTPIVDFAFCSDLKRLFGKNLRYILCNGATDCSETKDFFAFMLNLPVVELYGPDEAIVSLISVNDIWDHERRKPRNRWLDDDDDEALEDYEDMQLMFPKVNKNVSKKDTSKNLLITSSILCPTLDTRIRLEDWEDFRTSDQPYPRGRLVIGGDVVCKGYYQRPEAGNFYVDSNYITWFRTDDIARVFPNGSFEIISGLLDMIKMVDGQFISLSQIEHLLRNSQFVDNVCAICGEDRKFVIALVVPNLRRLALKSPGEANLKMAIGNEPEPEELYDIDFRREVCNDRMLSEFVSEHLSELMTKAGFQSIPKRIHLVPEIWTPETELVTPAFEPKRAVIQKFYASDIHAIFKTEFSFTRNRLSARLARNRDQQQNRFQQSRQSIISADYRSSH